MAYTAAPPPAPVVAAAATDAQVVVAESGIADELILAILALVLAVLVIMLFTVQRTLKRFAQLSEK